MLFKTPFSFITPVYYADTITIKCQYTGKCTLRSLLLWLIYHPKIFAQYVGTYTPKTLVDNILKNIVGTNLI